MYNYYCNLFIYCDNNGNIDESINKCYYVCDAIYRVVYICIQLPTG